MLSRLDLCITDASPPRKELQSAGVKPVNDGPRRFLDRVLAATGATAAMLIRLDRLTGHGGSLIAIGFGDQVEVEATGQELATTLISADQPIGSAAFIGDLSAGVNGGRYTNSTMVSGYVMEPATQLVLVLVRRTGEAAFDRVDARKLDKLRPWLDEWLRLWWWTGRQSAVLASLRGALRPSLLGVLALDGRGRLLEFNPRAAALLAEADALRRTAGGVAAAGCEDDARLQAAIRAAMLYAEPASRQTLSIRRKSRSPLAVAVAPAEEAPEVPTWTGDPAVTLFAVDPEVDLRALIGDACTTHDLSPTEARLVQHLVAGLSLSDAAARMHVQHDTARLYLKQVFAKTGVRRQANLVRLMLLSIVPLATAVPG